MSGTIAPFGNWHDLSHAGRIGNTVTINGKVPETSPVTSGERIRLRQNYDISGFSPEVQAILKGLKQYGMFVADNGIDWAISVAPDPRIPDLHGELRRVRGEAFEVVVAPSAAAGTQ